MFIAYHPTYAHHLPEGHRFPMLKYELIPGQLLYEGVITEKDLYPPQLITDEVVLLTHTADYLHKLKTVSLSQKEVRRIGFPQSAALTRRELMITQGTINCCLHALQNGVALNVAGGTHHAFADAGEGFCLLNDFAVATNYLLQQNRAKKILIIDLDVHQGNGTAKIFEGVKNVFTFSMHGRTNFPFHKEKSSLDIALEDAVEDEEYLQLLATHLPQIIKDFAPDFCCYLSGVDVLASDKFGKLKLTMNGCFERDRFVLQTLYNYNLPCAIAMGGGYSEDVRLIVQAHCQTFKLAKELYG